MSKLYRKVISAALAGLVLVSAFSGCGSSEQKPVATTTAAQKVEEKKPDLKLLVYYNAKDPNTYPVNTLLEQRTGYHVDYEMLPQDKPEDKLNIIMASGDAYDLVQVGVAGNSALLGVYSQFAKRGALMEITPLVEKYGPNLKSSISAESFEMAKVEGKVYAVPTLGLSNIGISLLVRQDWLDKLNMKVPSTLDEFTAMLKAFKEKDPGGVGTDKVIGLTYAASSSPIAENIRGAFGIANYWNDVNGRLISIIEDPGLKDYINYMSDLFNQGLLDKEFVTNKEATYKEKLTNGRAGVAPLGWSEIPTQTDTLQKNFPNGKFTVMPALKGSSGQFGLRATAGLDNLAFIPKSAKHPEDVMKFMNAKLEKETFKLMAIGEEGKHYKIEDGKYTPILPIFNDERGNANQFLTGLDEKNYPNYWQVRVRKDLRLFDAWDYMNNKLGEGTGKPDVIATAPYLPEYTQKNQQLKAMIDDYVLKVIAGGEPISGLDAFIQKWKDAGGEAVTKEINDWYANRGK